jgi:hypothetical protein
VKRTAIVWLVVSLFGARRRRSEWILPIVFVEIAIALLMLKLRFAP